MDKEFNPIHALIDALVSQGVNPENVHIAGVDFMKEAKEFKHKGGEFKETEVKGFKVIENLSYRADEEDDFRTAPVVVKKEFAGNFHFRQLDKNDVGKVREVTIGKALDKQDREAVFNLARKGIIEFKNLKVIEGGKK